MLLPAKTRITRPSRLKAKKSPGNKLRTQSSKTTAKRAGATKYGNFASRLLEALDPSRVKWAAFVTTTRPPADYIVSTSAKIERVDVTFSESRSRSRKRESETGTQLVLKLAASRFHASVSLPAFRSGWAALRQACMVAPTGPGTAASMIGSRGRERFFFPLEIILRRYRLALRVLDARPSHHDRHGGRRAAVCGGRSRDARGGAPRHRRRAGTVSVARATRAARFRAAGLAAGTRFAPRPSPLLASDQGSRHGREMGRWVHPAPVRAAVTAGPRPRYGHGHQPRNSGGAGDPREA